MRIAALALIVAVTAFAQQPRDNFSRPIPKVGHDPAMHLAISNPRVRVFRIELAAHGSASIGREVRDYVLLAVSGGRAEIAGPGNSFPIDLQAGEAAIFKGGWPHRLRSVSDAPSTWMVLEVARALQPERALCGLSGPSCGNFRFGKSDEGEYNESILFETPSARLSRAELAPNSLLPTHADRLDHVVIPIVPINIALAGDNAAHGAGDAIWVHGAFPDLRNMGSVAAKFVILELK